MMKLGMWAALASLVASAACVMDSTAEAPREEEPTGAVDTALNHGDPVPSGTLLDATAVRIGGCSGVIIGPRTVLSAAHCNFGTGWTVHFYDGKSQIEETRTVSSIRRRQGVWPPDDKYDDQGLFADIVVVHLNDDIPHGSAWARLPMDYPGKDAWGYRVGSGRHQNNHSLTGLLMYDWVDTRSSHDDNGEFLVEEADANYGDSGGPFLLYRSNGASYNVVAQGILSGEVYDWGYRTRYTSVAKHVGWVISEMAFDPRTSLRWRTGYRHFGNEVARHFPEAEGRDVCRYLCGEDHRCVAVNHWEKPGLDMCQLLSRVDFTGRYRDYSAGTR